MATYTPLFVDLAAARRSRDEQARHTTGHYYDEQAHILAQWTGSKPPTGLVIGELPYVNLNQLRLDTD